MKHVTKFEQFINEALNPKEFDAAVKDLAYSMPNHTKYDDETGPSEEQIINAMKKYKKDLYNHSTPAQKKEAVKMVQQILTESTNEAEGRDTLAELNEMTLGQLERIADYANMIKDRMNKGEQLESWMYSQLTVSLENLNSVHDAMDGNDGVDENALNENFPGKSAVVLAKDIDYDMMNYFDRTNVKLEVTPISGKKYSASVGQRFGDIFFFGAGAPDKSTWRLQLKEIKSVKILGYYGE
jgi:hypothetical protein